MKKCFIVSPIGNEGTDVRKRADQLFKHIIQPICEKCNFEAIRVDQLNLSDSITQTILDYLKDSELVIADLTGHNPNSFFEIGYRTSLKKPIIHLKQKGEHIPFDIASIRAFDYDLTDLDAVEDTKERLEKTINSFSYDSLEKSSTVESNNLVLLINEMQYKLDALLEDIKKMNSETIKTINETLNNQTSAESVENLMAKILIPELLKNPNAANSLIALGERFKSK